jgi:hypothetical protein
MLTIAADPKRLGIKIGFTSVLHTWGSVMTHHPHHMIVPGGGISLDGTRWIGCRPKYLLPVKVLSRLFRPLMLRGEEESTPLVDDGFMYVIDTWSRVMKFDVRSKGESTSGSQGTRNWVGAFEADTGKLVWRTFTIPALREPGSETWKDNHNAWRIGGASVWQTASYDLATNLLYYGTGDAFPTFNPEYRPGDNLYTASTIALDADTGKMAWY